MGRESARWFYRRNGIYKEDCESLNMSENGGELVEEEFIWGIVEKYFYKEVAG